MSRPSPRRGAFPFRFVFCLAVVLGGLGVVLATSAAAATDEGLARTERITNAEEQLQFGVRMAKRGLWSEALFRFRQAESFDPSNPRILNNIAVSYEALGRFDRALEAYQEAIRADRKNKDLRKNYSRFVEFYRAFRPEDQKDASPESSETQAAENTSPSPAATGEERDMESDGESGIGSDPESDAESDPESESSEEPKK